MSSSYRLQERRRDKEIWSFGPYYDHYVAPFGECHPDYTATEIGTKGGVKVCQRRVEHCIDELPQIPEGRYRGNSNLYWPDVPIPQARQPIVRYSGVGV